MAYEWITEALEETWGALERLMDPQPASAYERQTCCPGWSVRDILSHLIGFELMLRGEPVPAREGPWPEHVRNVVGELNEAFVEVYRQVPGPEVLELFRRTTRISLEHLRSLSDEAWSKVGWSPEGDRPYFRFMETRVLDSWIHLQDVRDALLEPADDHGSGEEIVVNRFESALPFVLGKKMHAPEGTVLRLNLSGRLARSVVIGVEAGRARALDEPVRDVTLEVTTPVVLFWRRAAGRISAEAFLSASATQVRGNALQARDFAEALAIMI